MRYTGAEVPCLDPAHHFRTDGLLPPAAANVGTDNSHLSPFLDVALVFTTSPCPWLGDSLATCVSQNAIAFYLCWKQVLVLGKHGLSMLSALLLTQS